MWGGTVPGLQQARYHLRQPCAKIFKMLHYVTPQGLRHRGGGAAGAVAPPGIWDFKIESFEIYKEN